MKHLLVTRKQVGVLLIIFSHVSKIVINNEKETQQVVMKKHVTVHFDIVIPKDQELTVESSNKSTINMSDLDLPEYPMFLLEGLN